MSVALRVTGFLICVAAYSIMAAYVAGIVMLTDCPSVEAQRLRCEQATDRDWLILLLVTLAVSCGLIWAFFLNGRKSKQP